MTFPSPFPDPLVDPIFMGREISAGLRLQQSIKDTQAAFPVSAPRPIEWTLQGAIARSEQSIYPMPTLSQGNANETTWYPLSSASGNVPASGTNPFSPGAGGESKSELSDFFRQKLVGQSTPIQAAPSMTVLGGGSTGDTTRRKFPDVRFGEKGQDPPTPGQHGWNSLKGFSGAMNDAWSGAFSRAEIEATIRHGNYPHYWGIPKNPRPEQIITGLHTMAKTYRDAGLPGIAINFSLATGEVYRIYSNHFGRI